MIGIKSVCLCVAFLEEGIEEYMLIIVKKRDDFKDGFCAYLYSKVVYL